MNEEFVPRITSLKELRKREKVMRAKMAMLSSFVSGFCAHVAVNLLIHSGSISLVVMNTIFAFLIGWFAWRNIRELNKEG